MEEKTFLTKEGYEKLKKELQHLKQVERKKIAKMLEEARGHGDIRENAEYHAAKDHQSHIETRILKLEKLLQKAEVHDISTNKHGVASLGCKVIVKNLKTGDEAVYKLVGHGESDPEAGSISISSPIGRALLGRRIGETVHINVPAGRVELRISLIEH